MKKNMTIDAAIEAAKKELVNQYDALGFYRESVEYAAMTIASKYPPKKGIKVSAAVHALLGLTTVVEDCHGRAYDFVWPTDNKLADGMKCVRWLINHSKELKGWALPFFDTRERGDELQDYRYGLPVREANNWKGSSFPYSEWVGGELPNSNFEKADLYGSDFSRTDLSGSNFRGADLREADLWKADLERADLREANLAGALLDGADLREANLAGACLRLASLDDAELYGANIKEADLRGAFCSRAAFARADLRGAILRGAWLDEANLAGADLTGADLTGANLTGANLERTILEGANLEGAILTQAWLHGANLRGVKLRGVSLIGADLSGANIEGANLEGVLWLAGGNVEFSGNQSFDVAGHHLAAYNGEVIEFGSEGIQKVSTIPVTFSYWDGNRWADPAPRVSYRVRVSKKGDRCVATFTNEEVRIADDMVICDDDHFGFMDSGSLGNAVREILNSMPDDDYVAPALKKRDLSAVAFCSNPADHMTLYASGEQSQEIEVPGYGTVSWQWTETVEDDGSILLQSSIQPNEGREAVSWLEDEDGNYVRDTGYTIFSIKGVAYSLTVRPASSIWKTRTVCIYVRRM